MLFAIAVLLIHPQLAPTISLSAEKSPIDAPAAISASTSAVGAENSSPTATASFDAATQPAAESNSSLPDAPAPVTAAVTDPAPIAFLKPGEPLKVTVDQLRAESHRKQIW